MIFIGAKLDHKVGNEKSNFVFIMKEDGSKELGFLDEGSAKIYAEGLGLIIDNIIMFLWDDEKGEVMELEEQEEAEVKEGN